MGRSRIMLVISNLDYGGAERQVLAIADHLDRHDFEPHICSLSPYVPLVGNPAAWPIPIHIVAKRHKFDVTVVPRLSALLKRLRIDLVHTFLFDADIAGRLAGRLAGVRTVIGSERNSDYRMPLLHKMLLRLTSRLNDAIVANSQAGKEFTLRTLGVPDTDVHVVYNGVDTQRFSSRPATQLRTEFALSATERVVGMVASFKPQKNYEMFLAVAQRVLREQPEVRFMSVGSPQLDSADGESAYYKEMVALAKSLGLYERCIFVGRRNDVADLYNLFDITVLTSTREGTPNVLLEAMASGVPAVVTNVADNAIHVQDGVNGFVVPLHDADGMARQILTLLANEPRRRDMGEAARRCACEQYSLSAMARSMGAVYTRCLTQASDFSWQMS